MTGTWASPCTQPASPDNWYITYYGSPGGRAGYLSDRGKGDAVLHTAIVELQVLSPATVRSLLRYEDGKWGALNGQAYDVITEFVGRNRMRTIKSTRVGDGKVLIDNGRFTSNGDPADVQERCSEKPST